MKLKHKILIRHILFSIAFSLGETMLVTSISFASVLFGNAGTASVASLYLSFSFGSLLSNWALDRTAYSHDKSVSSSLRQVLIYGQLGLLVFHCACLFYAKTVLLLDNVDVDSQNNETIDVDSQNNETMHDTNVSGNVDILIRFLASALLVLASIVSGLSVGIAWPAAGAFTTKSAVVLSALWTDDDDNYEYKYGDIITSSAEKSASVHVIHKEAEQVQLLLSTGAYYGDGKSSWDTLKKSSAAGTVQSNKSSWFSSDFHSVAGNLNGLFAGILIMSIILGHVFSAIELKVDDTNHVIQIYTQLFCGGILSTLIMVIFVHEPPTTTALEGDAHEELSPSLINHVGDDKGCNDDDDGQLSWFCVTENVLRSIMFPLQLTFQHPELSNLVGSHVTSGFRSGLILSFVGGMIVTDPSLIGILLAVKMGCSFITTPLFAWLGNSPRCFGRIGVLYIGLCSDFLVTLLAFIGYHQVIAGDELITSNVDDHNASRFVLCLIYIFGGIGFAAWQGTTSGALLSEVAASIATRRHNEVEGAGALDCCSNDSNAILTAAFSGCKAVSGTASAIAFFVFSDGNVPVSYIFGLCIFGEIVGFVQLLYGQRKGLWSLSSLNGSEEEEMVV